MQLWRYNSPIKQLGQRYTLVGSEPLGSGGMADVCLAWDERDHHYAAIKVIKPDVLDPKILQRFLREGKLVAALDHPHIIRIYGDRVQEEILPNPDPTSTAVYKVPYIVMERVKGGDLKKRLVAGQARPLNEIVRIFGQLCAAVQYAHDQGVIHRDIKPANILFREHPISGDQVVLSDFGLALLAKDTHVSLPEAGTPAYMAPEQWHGEPTFASDIYSLGVVLYQLCTGSLPPLWRPPERPTLLNPALPSALDDVILRALSKEPSQRFASASLFWQALKSAVQQTPLPNRVLPTPPPPLVIEPPSIPPSKDEGQQNLVPSRPLVGANKPITPLSIQLTPEQLILAKPSNIPTMDADIAGAKASSAVGPSSLVPASAIEPNAIKLPMSRGTTKVTKKLPPSALVGKPTQAVSLHAPITTPPTSRISTGKATARPPMRNLSAIGPGMPMNPRRTAPNRSRRRTLFTALILVTLLFALGAWALSAHPGMLASVGIMGNANPPTTITITPASKTVQDTYVMQGVTSGANPANRQITMRSLASTKTTTKPANITGHTQIPGRQATGVLTLFNGSTSQVTVAPTTITNSNGTQVIADQDVTIPGLNLSTHTFGSATVNAHAVSPGTNGNIAAGTINGTCCLQDNSISVTNGAFSGGQNAQNYNFLQVSDINAIVSANQDGLRMDAQNDIKGQIKTGEQLLGDINCNDPRTTEDVLPGASGINVTAANVTVSVTCNAQVFDAGAVQTIAQKALQQKASKDPGPGYVLAGTITTHAQQPVVFPDSTTFPVTAQGVWYYPWTTAMKQNLLNKIKGKSANDAQTILNSYPGVGSAKVSIGNGKTTLPTDVTQIPLDIQKVNGLSGGSQQSGSGTGGNSTLPSQPTITPITGNG